METGTVTVSRIHRLDGDSKLKAFVDVAFGNVVVKGLRVVSGSKGLFVGMPQQQGKDGKWYNIVCPATKEMQQELNDLVLAAYQEE